MVQCTLCKLLTHNLIVSGDRDFATSSQQRQLAFACIIFVEECCDATADKIEVESECVRVKFMQPALMNFERLNHRMHDRIYCVLVYRQHDGSIYFLRKVRTYFVRSSCMMNFHNFSRACASIILTNCLATASLFFQTIHKQLRREHIPTSIQWTVSTLFIQWSWNILLLFNGI